MTLNAKELTAIEDQLNCEKILVEKCKAYGEQCDDPELKKHCQTMAGKHQKHYETLLQFLN